MPSKRILSLIIVLSSITAMLTAQTESKNSAASKKGSTAKSTQWKVQNAMSAAPQAIAKNATIVAPSGTEGGEMVVLRKGSNDWTCMPDDPSTPANDPMCLDKNAMEWAEAWKSHTEPKLSGAGMGYMLQGGGSPSNTDPYATKPPEGKKWLQEPPHLMLFGVQLDPSVYSTDPNSGAPWIMWGGTPYEHLMIPVK
jgi:hypothetical protein